MKRTRRGPALFVVNPLETASRTKFGLSALLVNCGPMKIVPRERKNIFVTIVTLMMTVKTPR